jgi:hypothetical protein
MLDVHPPHHAASTWRDFFIHIATITVGLLIAVGLEQTVEWVHHLHQRHQLEEDLREEGEKNKELVQQDVKYLDLQWTANAARLRQVESALATRKKTTPPFSGAQAELSGAKHLFLMPFTAAWTTAKESARIDLIPQNTARKYARLYLQVDYLLGMETARRESGREVEAYRCRFSDGTMPCAPDLSRMTEEQLGEYAGLITRNFTHYREEKQRLLTFAALNQIVLDGESLDDQAAVVRYVYKIIDQYPDTFLVPVKDSSAAK